MPIVVELTGEGFTESKGLTGPIAGLAGGVYDNDEHNSEISDSHDLDEPNSSGTEDDYIAVPGENEKLQQRLSQKHNFFNNLFSSPGKAPTPEELRNIVVTTQLDPNFTYKVRFKKLNYM
jgi:hypothetical protein